MNKLKFGLGVFALGLASLTSCSNNAPKNYPVYDFKLNQFITREKGVDEKILNLMYSSYAPDFTKKYLKENLKYYQIVENLEQSFEFKPFSKNFLGEEASISKSLILLTVKTNLEIIDFIDKADYDSISKIDKSNKKYKSLKDLLGYCNLICEDIEKENQDIVEKVIRLYNFIGNYISPGEGDSKYLSLVELIDNKTGNCNSVNPAYYALFNHYKIDCGIVFGKVNGLHHN